MRGFRARATVEQATAWVELAHWVSVAVPVAKKSYTKRGFAQKVMAKYFEKRDAERETIPPTAVESPPAQVSQPGPGGLELAQGLE